MASEIEILRNQLKQISLYELLPKIIEDTQDEIIERVQGQMRQGLLSTGDKISPDYASDKYAEKKFDMNSAPGLGTPDAYLTGEFYKEMVVVADKDSFLTDSNAKRDNLAQYGSDLLRMSDENKSKYAHGILYERIKEAYAKVGIIFR